MWKTTEAREEGSCPFCIAGKMISGIAKANLGPTTFRERDPQCPSNSNLRGGWTDHDGGWSVVYPLSSGVLRHLTCAGSRCYKFPAKREKWDRGTSRGV